jgi:hypothetical protein
LTDLNGIKKSMTKHKRSMKACINGELLETVIAKGV